MGKNVFSQDAKDFLLLVTKGAKENKFFSRETTPFLLIIGTIYFSSFGYICFGVPENPNSKWAHPPPVVPDTRLYYISAVVVFILALAVDILGWVYTVNPLKRRLYSAIVFTNFIAGFTYLCFALDISPIWTSFAGRPLRPLLYLEWVSTTPTLIFLCAQLSAIPRKWTIFLMTSDILMIFLGLFASLASHYHMTLSILSHLLGIPTLIGLYKFLTMAINSTIITSDKQSLSTLRGTTLMVWCVFPIVWQASVTNLISPTTESMMFAILDVNAKAIYSAVLLGHNFFTIDQIQAFNMLVPKKETSKGPLDYKELLESLEDENNLEKHDTMKKLLAMAKKEVEKTKELQLAFLTGMICFCVFVIMVFYTPKLYTLFLNWKRS